MIILESVSLRRGSKPLFSQASVTIPNGQCVALIGANGCGKSSFFSLLLGQLDADQGAIRGMDKLRISHMAQESAAGTLSAQDYVLSGDALAYALLSETAAAEVAGDFDRAARLHLDLEAARAYDAPRRAERLLLGLGFAPAEVDQTVSQFSGGWRIRINLARALMTPSDLMLLDEPTNHLDLDATLWLQQWLKSYAGTLVIISHDRDFIDAVCERVMKIEGEQLKSYKGGYSDYENQRAMQLSQQQALHDKQQRQIADIEQFVRRFRAKATKAKQAQSRLKALERMERAAPAHVDSPFQFQFFEAPAPSDPLLDLRQCDLGYTQKRVLTQVDFALRPSDRIALLGKNGAGKSTFLKSLVGALPILDGERVAGSALRIGYFDQQQLEVLDLEASPFLHLQRLTPTAREQDILNFLGGFNFRGEQATSAIKPFSGGEKARLALAMVVWQRPNVLVLDEPTNHLDLDMRHALEVALGGFEGAVVLVSHDRHLLRNTAEQLWLVAAGRLRQFDDDLSAYEQLVLSAESMPAEAAGAQHHDHQSGDKKLQRQSAALRREALRPLQRAQDKAAARVAELETALAALQGQLADGALYDAAQQPKLTGLLQEEGRLKQSLETAEAEWLDALEKLEAAEASEER
jgi:ATP-binding cassette subfamily F protein 3